MVSEKEILDLTETKEGEEATQSTRRSTTSIQPSARSSRRGASSSDEAPKQAGPGISLNEQGEAALTALDSKIQRATDTLWGNVTTVPANTTKAAVLEKERILMDKGNVTTLSSHSVEDRRRVLELGKLFDSKQSMASAGSQSRITTVDAPMTPEVQARIAQPTRPRPAQLTTGTPGAFPVHNQGARANPQPARLTSHPSTDISAITTSTYNNDNADVEAGAVSGTSEQPPGAPPRDGPQAASDSNELQLQGMPLQMRQDLDLLVEARLVGERSTAFSTVTDDHSQRILAQASPIDENAPLTWKEILTSPRVLLVLFIIAAATAGIAVAATRKGDDGNDDAANNVSESAPAFDETLPAQTLQAIMDDPTSPQARANQWMLDETEFASVDPIRQRQRFALVAFFYATGGEQWADTGNWLNHSVNECDWGLRADWDEGFGTGESTSDDYYSEEVFDSVWRAHEGKEAQQQPGRIHACSGSNDSMYRNLILVPNNLVGTLPPELFMFLPELSVLMLGWNPRIVGTLPSEVGLLASTLEVLDMDDLSLLGSIPTEVGKLEQLQSLNLYHNHLTGPIPSELGNLQRLEHLLLDTNQLTGNIPSEIGRIETLLWFTLEACQLTGTFPEEIVQNSPFLYDIRLGFNFLSGTIPSGISDLGDMVYLHMGHNALTGSLPDLSRLMFLEGVELGSNALTGTIDGGVGMLGNLGEFILTGNAFQGPIPTEIGALSQLTALELRKNQLTSLPSTIGLLDALVKLDVSQNPLVGSIPSEIGLLTNLESFHLSETYRSGAVPPEVCKLQEDGLLKQLAVDCKAMQCCA